MAYEVDLSNVPSATNIALGIVFLYAIYGLIYVIYNVYFHPLSKFPGPASHAATEAASLLELVHGRQVPSTKAMHDKYGEVVRITPDQLSFTTAQAWKDIYGTRHGKRQIPKDHRFYLVDPRTSSSIITANDADHTRIRRNLAHAFSDTALRGQEPILTHYFELLVSQLKDRIGDKPFTVFDMTKWYNYTTFDIIGDLTYGASFGALESGEYHPWIASIFKAIKFGRYMRFASRYPGSKQLLKFLINFVPSFAKGRQTHMNYTSERTERRLQAETDRTDFMTYILRHNDEKGMTRKEIKDTNSTLIVAGSETTATLLSGATYWLLRTPETYKKVQDEVRSAFKDVDDMTLMSTGQLPYLHAVLEESLRMYPPVPTLMPRLTAEDEIIDGHFVPKGTSIGVHQYSAFLTSKNFHNPDDFVPERWLADPPEEYKYDDKAAMQAFSTGPRNCIGKNLAYSEMRSILARMLWHFEWELCDDSKGWKNQPDYLLWSKPPLNVKLSHRKF